MMRKRIGDWSKVLQLLDVNKARLTSKQADGDVYALVDGDKLAGIDDLGIEEAYDEIGRYYLEKQDWQTALKYALLAHNQSMQAECFYALEDYDGLSSVLSTITENNPFLPVNFLFLLLFFYFFNFFCLFVLFCFSK
jgi:WD repeat-containing protein 35